MQKKQKFDRAIIDFGTIHTTIASSINIQFDAVVINNQPVSSTLFITAAVEYFSGYEIWVGQGSMSYTASTEPVFSILFLRFTS